MNRKRIFFWMAAGTILLGNYFFAFGHVVASDPNEFPKLRNPVDIAISPDGSRAIVVCHNNSIAVINLQSGNYEIKNIAPEVWPGQHPIKAVFIGNNCFVINEYSEFITEFDPVTLRIVANHRVPIYCQDMLYDEAAGVIYLTNKWLDEVLVYNKSFQSLRSGIRVGRNPKALALSNDRQRLYVGNAGSWNISVIDLNSDAMAQTIYLGSGPTAMASTPEHLIVTNHGGRNLKTVNGAPLIENDQADIANVVTFINQQTGTIEERFVNAGADYADLRFKDGLLAFAGAATGSVHLYRLDQTNAALRTIDLLADEWGLPGGRALSGLRIYANTRTVAIKDKETIYGANYFRDTVVEIKYRATQNRYVVTREIPLNAAGVAIVAFRNLGSGVFMNNRQNGERYFNTIAGWFRGQRNLTCATCHPNGHSDFRFILDKKADPFNAGRQQGPEKHPSAISSNITAPYAWEGNLSTLVDFNNEALNAHDVPDGTAKIHHDVSRFLVAFEELLRPEPNPYPAANGEAQNPNAPQRGKSVFVSAGCFDCHRGSAFTDRATHDVGTGRKLDTPSLVQLWDKAPYLHDGRAETLADLLDPGIYDKTDAHGKLSPLTAAQKEDLTAYLLSIQLGDIPTRVETANGEMPVTFALQQNYPNPFAARGSFDNPETAIGYQIPVAARVELVVYNGLGQRVRTLIHAKQAPGHYQMKWDGRDETGHPAPSGVYLYRLRATAANGATAFMQTNKMVKLQ